MNLTAWGIISPTKPIVPQKHTLTAVTSEAIPSSIFFKREAFRPRDTAVSSPVERMLRFPEFTSSSSEPIKITGSMTSTVFQLAPVMLPKVQNIMRWACSLEAIIIRETIEEHKNAK